MARRALWDGWVATPRLVRYEESCDVASPTRCISSLAVSRGVRPKAAWWYVGCIACAGLTLTPAVFAADAAAVETETAAHGQPRVVITLVGTVAREKDFGALLIEWFGATRHLVTIARQSTLDSREIIAPAERRHRISQHRGIRVTQTALTAGKAV